MERKAGLDLLRTFAILFVVGIHFFYHTDFYTVPIAGKNMITQVILRWIFTMCVPLFMMLTGYLQTEKKPKMKYFKKLIPILGVYMFYSVLSILMRITYLNEEKSILSWIKSILIYDADKYSWYINMYIGLFLLAPFLNMIHKSLKSAKEYKIFLFVLILLTAFPTFFNSLSSQMSAFKALSFSDWWTRIYPITYYFLGAYIKKYPIKISKKIGFISLGVVIAVESSLTLFYSWNTTFINVVGDYGSILIVAETVLFFIIFYDIKIKSKIIGRLLGTISVLSLDIYLCSYISDKLVYTFVRTNLFKYQQQIMFYFVFIVSASFLIAFFTALLRYKVVRLKFIQNSKIHKSISQ